MSKNFFDLLEKIKPLKVVGAVNAYNALLAEKSGLEALYLSGAGVANASYGIPDLAMTSKDNVLAVSWYDGSDDIGRILSKVSYDHGQSFQDLIIVDTNDVYGHTDIVITEDKQILVSWLGNENNDLVLKIKQISAKNDSDPFIVYRETGLGPSDFPKIEYYDNKLFIAWTSYDKTMQVKTKIIHLE